MRVEITDFFEGYLDVWKTQLANQDKKHARRGVFGLRPQLFRAATGQTAPYVRVVRHCFPLIVFVSLFADDTIRTLY